MNIRTLLPDTPLRILPLILLLGACGSEGEKPPHGSDTSTAAPALPAPDAMPTTAVDSSSPSGALARIFEAGRKRDVATYKRLMTKSSITMMEEIAALDSLSLNESISRDMTTMAEGPTPAMRNEFIRGDSAMVDVEVGPGAWQPFLFVREEGEWKLAYDYLLNTVLRSIQESGEGGTAP